MVFKDVYALYKHERKEIMAIFPCFNYSAWTKIRNSHKLRGAIAKFVSRAVVFAYRNYRHELSYMLKATFVVKTALCAVVSETLSEPTKFQRVQFAGYCECFSKQGS